MAKSAKRKTAKGTSPEEQTEPVGSTDPVEVMLTLVAAEGWRPVTLSSIAAACSLSLSELYGRYPSKTALLTDYVRRIDAAMLSALDPVQPSQEREAVKDRLFEAIMARFDAMTPHKAAIRVLMRDLPGDPVALSCFLYTGLGRALDWTLAAAELDTGGLAGLVRRNMLGALYIDTLRVWLRDDSEDMARTMAHLDKRLGQAIRWLTARGPVTRMRRRAAASFDPGI